MSHLGTDYLNGPAGQRQLEEDYAHVEQFFAREVDNPSLRKESHAPASGSGSAHNISETERLISAAAGAGLVALGLARGRWDGLLLGGLGGALIWRGYTGRCQCYTALGINTAEHNPATAIPARQGAKVERKITIRRSPEELYNFWRDLENLPRFMVNVKKVEQCDAQRSHWVVNGPLGTELEWDAEIYNERANELIAWRSLPGGDVETAGSIHFKPSHQTGCTEVTLSLKYNPPAGKIGAKLADWFGDGLDQKLDDDLERFKHIVEAEGTTVSSGAKLANTANT